MGQGTWFDDSNARPLPRRDEGSGTARKQHREKERRREPEAEMEPDEYKPDNISRERRAWLAAMVTLAKQRRKEREAEAESEMQAEAEAEIMAEIRGRRTRRGG